MMMMMMMKNWGGKVANGYASNCLKQDAQLSQKGRERQGALVLAKSGRLELGDNILQTVT